MALQTDFQTFFNDIELDCFENIKTTVAEITKKLNKEYYGLEQDESSHMTIVGSVGRHTAIRSVSDIDLIFDLSPELFTQFNNHETNGQSNLLQDVKNKLRTRYSRTELKGDGQVVVIGFENYTVELVPAFKQSDGSFKYPDANDGGSWKVTNPLQEIEACAACEDQYKGIYFNFCHLVRSWRNTVGFKFGGLLIDTLVAKHLYDSDYDKDVDYFTVLKSLLSYLSTQDPEQNYWYAIGSNQQVTNSEKGKFVSKASDAFESLQEAEKNNENLNDVLRDLFGTSFPEGEDNSNKNITGDSWPLFNNTEEFIENKFPIDIRYSLSIDADVKKTNFNISKPLGLYLKNLFPLDYDHELIFRIKETDCLPPYQIYWKVRNVGEEAIKRNDIRGQIVEGKKTHYERTVFSGPHFVECYLVKNGICVAKSRISVPIKVRPKRRSYWRH